MKRLEPIVENLLHNQPELRNSDKKLLMAVWERQGLYLSQTQQMTFMNSCSVAESITRARRKLKDQYPADKEVTENRYNKYKEYKQEYFDKQINFFRRQICQVVERVD